MIDNFERARKAIKPKDAEGDETNNRYLAMSNALMSTLASIGMEVIPTVGTEFDYNLHMAIQQASLAHTPRYGPYHVKPSLSHHSFQRHIFV